MLLTFAQDGCVRLWQETDTSESLRFFVTAVINGSSTSPPTIVPQPVHSISRTDKLLSAAWLNVYHPLYMSDSAALPATFGGKRGSLPSNGVL